MGMALPASLNLLNKLMSAAGWHCTESSLFEAVPHMSDNLSPNDIKKTLDNLEVPTTEERCRLKHITAADCPALFVDSKNAIYAILDAKADMLLMSSASMPEPTWEKPRRSSGRIIRVEKFTNTQTSKKAISVSDVMQRFRPLMPWLIFATFMSNLTGLATPLLIMVIYDRVIPSGSIELVLSLIAIVLVFIATDAGFRAARSSALAHMGKETEQTLGLALFQKLMALPIDQIQKSTVEQQLARFKQFEGFRDVFTGQLLTTFLDLPFTLIFFFVLFWLSPQIALLIAALALVFIAASIYFVPVQQKLGITASQHRTELQAHVFEAASHQRVIQRLGLGDHWIQKQAFLMETAARSTQLSTASSLISQNIGQSLMAVAGIGAVYLGTISALSGDLSFGALIAIMSLVWKILSPLQALYSSIPQIFGFLKSKEQSDRVLGIPEELVRGVAQSHQKTFKGKLSLSGVTKRYDASSNPALSQLTLNIEPNEFVVLCGGDSSGKTTLLNLLCGFYQPTIGTALLDGVDIRQIPVDDLRKSVTYSQPDLFYGTVFQNFRLAAPSLTEAQVTQSLGDMNLGDIVSGFPEGIHTRLSETFRDKQTTSTLRALALARSFARGGSVLLLNEPTYSLDPVRRSALVKTLNQIKGQRTILVASQDPEIIRLADRYIYLDEGRLVVNDVGRAGAKKLYALLARNTGD